MWRRLGTKIFDLDQHLLEKIFVVLMVRLKVLFQMMGILQLLELICEEVRWNVSYNIGIRN